MQLLQHIIEPKRLSIVWQTLQENIEHRIGTGRRYIVGELKRIDDNIVLHYFKNDQDFKDAVKLGFKGYSIFDMNQDVYNLNIMNTLERRIPPSQRADFDDFLRYHRIDPNAGRKMSEFALLGYTGGKLPGDAFSFVHTFEEANIPCELTIDVAGVRHYKAFLPPLDTLLGKQVSFQAEHENVQDSMAVAIKMRNGKLIGYVNRAQTFTFNEWLANNYEIDGIIERINGNPDRPNVLLYVKVKFK